MKRILTKLHNYHTTRNTTAIIVILDKDSIGMFLLNMKGSNFALVGILMLSQLFNLSFCFAIHMILSSENSVTPAPMHTMPLS